MLNLADQAKKHLAELGAAGAIKVGASQTVGRVMPPGAVVIYESTVYPGCTEEVCVPVLEQASGMRFNESFYCGYSPERINPGDKVNTLTTIKKITSGSTPEVALFIDALYASIIPAGTWQASSIKVAEAAKVIENTQRDLNIAFVNELSVIFERMGIDTLEVLEAAGLPEAGRQCCWSNNATTIQTGCFVQAERPVFCFSPVSI